MTLKICEEGGVKILYCPVQAVQCITTIAWLQDELMSMTMLMLRWTLGCVYRLDELMGVFID